MKQIDPSTPHPSYGDLARKANVSLDAFNGEVAEYIPSLVGQTSDEYKAYVGRAAYFNVVDRTAQALIGAMMRKPYTTTNLAQFPLTDQSSIDTFLQYSIRSVLLGGKIGMLVDAVNTPQGVRSKIITYTATDIINWGDNFFVIKETVLMPDSNNRFSLIPVTTYRELFLDEEGFYASQTWSKSNGNWFAELNPQLLVSGLPIEYVPLWVANPYDNTDAVYTPPLFTQASLNIQWFKQAIDLAHYAHFMALPTPVIVGDLKSWVDDAGNNVTSEVYLGSTSKPTQLTIGSTFEYMEVSGVSFKMLQDEMKNLEERMYIAGSRLLSVKKGVESVEALQVRSGSESAVLETITNTLESALTGALQLCAEIDRNMATNVSIRLNKDFTAAKMEPASVKSILDLYTASVITLDQALSALYEGEVIEADELQKVKTNTEE